jgi:hypothetical protein
MAWKGDGVEHLIEDMETNEYVGDSDNFLWTNGFPAALG